MWHTATRGVCVYVTDERKKGDNGKESKRVGDGAFKKALACVSFFFLNGFKMLHRFQTGSAAQWQKKQKKKKNLLKSPLM